MLHKFIFEVYITINKNLSSLGRIVWQIVLLDSSMPLCLNDQVYPKNIGS